MTESNLHLVEPLNCCIFAGNAQVVVVAAAQDPRLPTMAVRQLPDACQRATDQLQNCNHIIKQCESQLTGQHE